MMERAQGAPIVHILWPSGTLSSIADAPAQATAVILGVEDAGEFKNAFLATGLAAKLARKGVLLFAMVGREAEVAHDALDWTLEEIGADAIATSWHDPDDPDDVATFVLASCRAGGVSRIVACLDNSSEWGSTLLETVANALRDFGRQA